MISFYIVWDGITFKFHQKRPIIEEIQFWSPNLEALSYLYRGGSFGILAIFNLEFILH